MTTKEAITHRALRCRPSKRDKWISTHEALLAEAEYLQQRKYTWWERNWLGVCFVASGIGSAACIVGVLRLVFG